MKNILRFFHQGLESQHVLTRVQSPKCVCRGFDSRNCLVQGLIPSQDQKLNYTDSSRLGWASWNHWRSITAPSRIYQDSYITLQGELNYIAPGEAYASFIGIPVVVNHLAWISITIILSCFVCLSRMNHRTRGSCMASLLVHCSPSINESPRQQHGAPGGA